MDFGQAALLIGAVYALTEFAKKLVPTLDARITQVVSLVIAIGAVFLVADSVWAHEQVVGGKALDTLNAGSKVLVGILIGAGANVLHSAFGAVKSIGENQPDA